MSSKEFVNQNMGYLVRCGEGILREHPGWTGWEGEIIGGIDVSVQVKTLRLPPTGIGVQVGEIYNWASTDLEIIFEAPIFPDFKDNISTCTKCNKQSCTGLERIECLMRN